MATIGVTRLTIKPQVFTIVFVISVIFILLILEFTFTNTLKDIENEKQHETLSHQLNIHKDKILDLKIDQRIFKLPDTRSLYCKQIVYDFKQKNIKVDSNQMGLSNTEFENLDVLNIVSIILIFNDYQFYEMKKSLESILVDDGLQMVLEILVVDDATTLDYILEHSLSYLSKIPLVKLMRTNTKEPLGTAKTRNLAAKEAKGKYLVFIDNTVVVTKGWLQPLVHWLLYNPSSIVTPHFDLIKEPVSMAYVVLPDNTTFTITLTLAIRPFQLFAPLNKINNQSYIEKDQIDYSHTAVYDSPASRGDVVAVKKTFFENVLGGYDEKLETFGGGEHVDLSLKAWLCGSGVKIVTCSRVGAVNVLDPVKTRLDSNVKLLVNKWFAKSGFKTSIYKLASKVKASDQNDGEEEDNEKSQKNDDVETPQCKISIKQYIKKIAVNIVKLRADSVAYGMLKAGTNRCARVIKADTMMKVKMDICEKLIIQDPRGKDGIKSQDESEEKTHERETIFQLSITGYLRVGEKRCLTTKENAYLSVEECRDNDDKQRFKYKDGLLINYWSKFCVMQVTDPDPLLQGDKQIAMVQACDSYTEKEKEFMIWVFINL